MTTIKQKQQAAGSDCVEFRLVIDKAGQGHEIDKEAANVDLERANLVWTHVNFATPGSTQWLLDQGLDGLVADTMTEFESRPRMFAHGGGLLVILRGVNLNAGADPDDMVSIRLWLEKNRVITAVQRPLISVADVRSMSLAGQGAQSLGDFLLILVERLADRIGHVVNNIEENIGEFEDALETSEHGDMRRQLGRSRRQVAAIRRFLAPQRDALDSVYQHSSNLLLESEKHALREQTNRITRFVEDLDLVREQTLVLHEDLVNRVAQEQNSRMYLLSIVSAIFLPLSFLTGLFGMNVAGLPGTESVMAFTWVMLGMGLAGAGIIAFMRWKRWI